MNPPSRFMYPPFFAATIILLALMLLPSFTRAADVTWGTPQQIAADSDVSTTGNAIGAFNVGDTGVPSTTVNGVPFQSFAAPSGNGSSGNYAMSGAFGVFSNNTAGGSPSAPFSALSAVYRTMLMSWITPLFSPATLTISGLNIGLQYQFQFWSNNSSDHNSYQITATGGINSVALGSNDDHADGGRGEWVTGTFTADASTQSFSFLGDGDGGFLNGFQLRQIVRGNAVPESGSTFGFLALGLTGLLFILPKFRDRRTL